MKHLPEAWKKRVVVFTMHILSLLILAGWVLILAMMVDVSPVCIVLFGLYWPLVRLMRYLEKKYWRFW